jgi:peptidoglycan/xylan/chitin deacetylase (PgdA/CDA1 family)
MASRQVHNVSFHGIGDPGAEREPGEHDYWVSRDSFLRILDECAAHPRVRLSFDDGNESDAAIALPALLDRGLTAEFFVLAGRLDTPGNLATESVRALVEAGMGVGTHGLGHRPWNALSPADVPGELEQARGVIAEATGRPVDRAACPFGAYDRRVLSRLRALGYERVYTSDRRRCAEGDWLQPRFSVRAGDTAASVRAEITASHDLGRRVRDTAVGAVKRWR